MKEIGATRAARALAPSAIIHRKAFGALKKILILLAACAIAAPSAVRWKRRRTRAGPIATASPTAMLHHERRRRTGSYLRRWSAHYPLWLRGRTERLKEFPDQLGKSGEPQFQLRGGHRVWKAPEDPVASWAPDNAPVHIELAPDGLTAREPIVSFRQACMNSTGFDW